MAGRQVDAAAARAFGLCQAQIALHFGDGDITGGGGGEGGGQVVVVHADGGEINEEIHLQQAGDGVAGDVPVAAGGHGLGGFLQFGHVHHGVLHPVALVDGQVPDAAGEGSEHQIGAGDVGEAFDAGDVRGGDGDVFVAGDHLAGSEGALILGDGDAALVGDAGRAGGLADGQGEVAEVPVILDGFGVFHLLPKFFLH